MSQEEDRARRRFYTRAALFSLALWLTILVAIIIGAIVHA